MPPPGSYLGYGGRGSYAGRMPVQGYGGRGSEVTNLEHFPISDMLFANEYSGLVFEDAPKPAFSSTRRAGITSPGGFLSNMFGGFSTGSKPTPYNPAQGFSMGTELAAYNPAADHPYVPMTGGQTGSSAPYPIAIDGPMLALERAKQMLGNVLDSIGAKGDTVEITPVSYGPNQAGNFGPQTLFIVGIAAVGIYLAMKK